MSPGEAEGETTYCGKDHHHVHDNRDDDDVHDVLVLVVERDNHKICSNAFAPNRHVRTCTYMSVRRGISVM